MVRSIAKFSAFASIGLIAGCTTSAPSQVASPPPKSQVSSAPPALASRPSATASVTPPKLVAFSDTFVWDRPSAFGPVPTALAEKGQEVCASLNRGAHSFRASGYHPAALDSKGVPFLGGGFFCELNEEKPAQVAAAGTSPTIPTPPPTVTASPATESKPAQALTVAPAPEPTPAPAPVPVPTPVPAAVAQEAPKAAEPDAKAEAKRGPVELVQASMRVWQDSWQARDPYTYLALFDSSFPDLNRYSANRQKRMSAAKFIELTVEDAVYREEGDRVIVRFRQKYRSNTFSSDEIKELVWRLTAQGPRIVEERFIRR